MSDVQFWVLLGNKLEFVSARLDDWLIKLFTGLQTNPGVAQHILRKVSYRDCKFYRLNNPVPVGDDDTDDEDSGNFNDIPDEVIQACLADTNRVYVNPVRTRVRRLAQDFFDDKIHLVIDLPDPLRESNNAIGNLRRDHAILFSCLQVTVETMGNWRPEDVQRNLQGGVLTNSDHGLPPEFRDIQQALATKRVYQADDEQKRDFQNARIYQKDFDGIFAPRESETVSHTVINDREYAAFYNVLRCYGEDAQTILAESSSALKASNFTVHFIQPPFFSGNDNSRGFKYHQEKSWGFPIFVDINPARHAWRRFTPRSDWMVISPDHQIPFVISEVISQKQEKDRSRMLVEAIALARTGQFLVESTSKRTFFVVAVCVDAKMVASRYIVMQTGRGNREHSNSLYHDKAVCIHRKDFELKNSEEQVDFLREMYNLATQISALSGDLGQLKKNRLGDIKAAARRVLSLSLQTKTAGSSVMDSITEGSDGLQDDDDLGVFEAKDVQNILHQMDYKIEFIAWGHPQLAVIVNKTGDKHGYLKFVEREREINVLQYLMDIKSPSNHTISGVRFWPVEGGTVISMPVAGGWLTSLDNPDAQLWSVAVKLFEGVAFMHEHNVAHMDLKPQNVIIPSEGGRLSIIDFSVSIRVRGPNVRYTGVVGTEDYMAPEVRKGLYKPMLADLWSCGRTLEELCSRCHASSADRTTLLEIARRLMNRDPEARPKISTVLECMALSQREKDNLASPTLG